MRIDIEMRLVVAEVVSIRLAVTADWTQNNVDDNYVSDDPDKENQRVKEIVHIIDQGPDEIRLRFVFYQHICRVKGQIKKWVFHRVDFELFLSVLNFWHCLNKMSSDKCFYFLNSFLNDVTAEFAVNFSKRFWNELGKQTKRIVLIKCFWVASYSIIF